MKFESRTFIVIILNNCSTELMQDSKSETSAAARR